MLLDELIGVDEPTHRASVTFSPDICTSQASLATPNDGSYVVKAGWSQA
jgi:hypothetical protein